MPEEYDYPNAPSTVELRNLLNPTADLNKSLATGLPGSPTTENEQLSGVWGQIAQAEKASPIGSPAGQFMQAYTMAKAENEEEENRAAVMWQYREDQKKQQVKDVMSQALDIFKVTGRTEDYQAVVQQLEGNPYGANAMKITPKKAGKYIKVVDQAGNAYEVDETVAADLRKQQVPWMDIIEQQGRMTEKAKKEEKKAPTKIEVKTPTGTRTRLYQAGEPIEDTMTPYDSDGSGGGGGGSIPAAHYTNVTKAVNQIMFPLAQEYIAENLPEGFKDVNEVMLALSNDTGGVVYERVRSRIPKKMRRTWDKLLTDAQENVSAGKVPSRAAEISAKKILGDRYLSADEIALRKAQEIEAATANQPPPVVPVMPIQPQIQPPPVAAQPPPVAQAAAPQPAAAQAQPQAQPQPTPIAPQAPPQGPPQGPTATNPATGQTIMLVNGQWIPVDG